VADDSDRIAELERRLAHVEEALGELTSFIQALNVQDGLARTVLQAHDRLLKELAAAAGVATVQRSTGGRIQ
jgi:uncharacterized coiled-coil protein SlyX